MTLTNALSLKQTLILRKPTLNTLSPHHALLGKL